MKVLTLNYQRLIGWLLAFFFLVGKWSPAKLIDSEAGGGLFFLELRFLAVVGIFILTGLLEGQRQRQPVVDLPRPRIHKLTVLLGMFLLWAMLTTLWAPDFDLAVGKFYDVSLLFFLVIALHINLRKNNPDELLFGFWTGILVLGFMMAALALMSAGAGKAARDDNRTAVLGGGPIVLGRNMGLMILAALYMQSRVKLRWLTLKPVFAVIAAMGLAVILLTGSRGALLSVCVAGAVYFLLDKTSWPKKIVILAAGFCAFLLFLFITEIGRSVQEMFMTRVIELTFEKKYAAGRGNLWIEAVELAKQHLGFGVGISGFKAGGFAHNGIVQPHPHNIFLEVLCETGLAGFFLFIGACMAGFAAVRRNWRFKSVAAFSALVLNLTLAQSSGDFFDSRGVFIFLYLTLIPDRAKAPAAIKAPPDRSERAFAFTPGGDGILRA